MMLKLNDREWKAFFIEDFFSIKSGKRLTKADMRSGDIAFVGASDSNNGITQFVANENESTDQNVLGVNYNGSVVENFYHPYKATFSDDVKRVSINEMSANNKYSLLFIKQCILQQKSKYAYGYKFNGKRMRRQKLLLPIDSEGIPDWAFMSQYMREQEKLILEQVLPHFQKKLMDNLLVLGATPDTEWGGYRLSDLFHITIGKNLDGNKIDKTSGTTPYVTRKETNNGIDGFTDGHDVEYLWNQVPAITIGNETAKPYVQTTSFYTGTKVNILTPKASLPAPVLGFIARCLEANKNRYSYSYTANSTRLAEQRIMLPTTSDGQLNVSYMEQTIARIETDTLTYLTELMQNRYDDLVTAISIRGGELTNRTWENFFISGNQGIFTLRATSSGIDRNKLAPGTKSVPYITRSDQKNGTQDYVAEIQNSKYQMDPGNVITIGLDTQTVFYQPRNFYTGQNIQILEQANLNHYNAMFVIPLIKQQMVKFNWGGNGATLGRLSRTKIALPAVSANNADWDFMSRYACAQESLLLAKQLRSYR